MGCCGQGRAALRAAGTPGGRGRSISRQPPTASALRYLGGRHVRIRGAVSGRLYEFTGGTRTAVDASDAPAMVRTGLFARY
jgi:hypothetical protein